MPNNTDRPVYRAFLLRMWADRSGDYATGLAWRFAVESIDGAEKRAFASIEALLVYLRQQMEQATQPMPFVADDQSTTGEDLTTTPTRED